MSRVSSLYLGGAAVLLSFLVLSFCLSPSVAFAEEPSSNSIVRVDHYSGSRDLVNGGGGDYMGVESSVDEPRPKGELVNSRFNLGPTTQEKLLRIYLLCQSLGILF